jgi:hypothetical protein
MLRVVATAMVSDDQSILILIWKRHNFPISHLITIAVFQAEIHSDDSS